MFPFLGALVLFGTFLLYETYLENQVFGAPDSNRPQWPLTLVAAGMVAVLVLRLARLSIRRHVLPAIALQALGAVLLLAAWIVLLGVFANGHCGPNTRASWAEPGLAARLGNATPVRGIDIDVNDDGGIVKVDWRDGHDDLRLVVIAADVTLTGDIEGWTDDEMQASVQGLLARVGVEGAAFDGFRSSTSIC